MALIGFTSHVQTLARFSFRIHPKNVCRLMTITLVGKHQHMHGLFLKGPRVLDRERWCPRNFLKETSKLNSSLSQIPTTSSDSGKHGEAISQWLGCSLTQSQELLEEYPFLKTVTVVILREKVKILQSYNISPSLFVDNPRVIVQTSAEEISRRLNILDAKGLLVLDHVMTHRLDHYLECSARVFQIALRNLCLKKEAFGHCRSYNEYLCFRLGCSEDVAEGLLTSYPLKHRTRFSIMKLESFLDFMILETNLSSEFIIKHINLVGFSVSRLQRRWEVMSSAGVTSEKQMIAIWFMSENSFIKEYGVHL